MTTTTETRPYSFRLPVPPAPVQPVANTVTGDHCQQCGADDRESTHGGDQGYSACCNKLVVFTPAGQSCSTDVCGH